MVGTGKYDTLEQMRAALDASGSEIVTVAVRRVNLDGQEESLLDYIDLTRYFLLPNTAAAMALGVQAGRTAFEAGVMQKSSAASPSSPTKGRVGLS